MRRRWMAQLIHDIYPLHESEIFGGLAVGELSSIAPICDESRFSEGALLFAEGHSAGWLYIVTEVLVALQTSMRVPHATQPRRTTVALCGRGEIVGWSALVEPFRYVLSASAWDDCRLIAIDASLLRRSLASNPVIGFVVMQSLFQVMPKRALQVTEALVKERQIAAARFQTFTDR